MLEDVRRPWKTVEDVQRRWKTFENDRKYLKTLEAVQKRCKTLEGARRRSKAIEKKLKHSETLVQRNSSRKMCLQHFTLHYTSLLPYTPCMDMHEFSLVYMYIYTYVYHIYMIYVYIYIDIHIITSIRLRAQQRLFTLELPRNHSKTLRLSTNPLESAAPDPLEIIQNRPGATGCSNWLLQSHQAIQSALEITQNRPSGLLKSLLGLTEPLENARKSSKTIENARRRFENARRRSKTPRKRFENAISKLPGSETLDSVWLRSAALSTVHGYARVHSSIYIYMYIYIHAHGSASWL